MAIVKLGTKASGDRVTLAPQTKTTIAELPFKEENTCAFAGTEPLKGEVTLDAPTGQTDEASQAVEGLGSLENNSLEVAKDKAYVEAGKTVLKLASGSKWSFEE